MFELSRDVWTEPGCLNWDMMFELRHDVWTEPGCLNWVGMFELSRDVRLNEASLYPFDEIYIIKITLKIYSSSELSTMPRHYHRMFISISSFYNFFTWCFLTYNKMPTQNIYDFTLKSTYRLFPAFFTHSQNNTVINTD